MSYSPEDGFIPREFALKLVLAHSSWTPNVITVHLTSQAVLPKKRTHISSQFHCHACRTEADTGLLWRIAKPVMRLSDRQSPHSILLQVVSETVNWRATPTSRAGKKGRIYYATQAAVRPPTFVFFVNDVNVFSEDYRRYVERQLRDNVGFPGSPIRVYWRGKPQRSSSLRSKKS